MKEPINKIKRILALIGAILLAGLYVITLIFAITDNPATMSYFKASVAMTVAVPVLLYAYQLVYRVLKSYNKSEEATETDIKKSEK